MVSELAPGNFRTIRGAAFFLISCRWKFLCQQQPWMIAFGLDRVDVGVRPHLHLPLTPARRRLKSSEGRFVFDLYGQRTHSLMARNRSHAYKP